MDYLQIAVTLLVAIVPAVISYFVARYQGKTDIKKLIESNKADIEKLIKQHEIDLEALKEKHRLEMELKDKEQEYKLQLMQKEYELKVQEQQQTKTNDVMTDVLGGLFTDIMKKPAAAKGKIDSLKKLGDQLKDYQP